MFKLLSRCKKCRVTRKGRQKIGPGFSFAKFMTEARSVANRGECHNCKSSGTTKIRIVACGVQALELLGAEQVTIPAGGA